MQVVHTGSGLFRDTTNFCNADILMKHSTLKQNERTGEILGILLMYGASQIVTIIKNHVQCLPSSKSGNCLLDAPVVFLFGFALPGKDRNAGRSNTELMVSAQKHKQMTID